MAPTGTQMVNRYGNGSPGLEGWSRQPHSYQETRSSTPTPRQGRTFVIDHRKVFISDTFTTACRTLGISVQLGRPATPTDKPRGSYCASFG